MSMEFHSLDHIQEGYDVTTRNYCDIPEMTMDRDYIIFYKGICVGFTHYDTTIN